MQTMISIENISKSYKINHARQITYNTFREAVTHQIRALAQRCIHPLSPNQENVDVEIFYALKDVSFDVMEGDRVGIIGRNGAGKSTLLKILSRITSPTTGVIEIAGRVASLLEVGTGFHPELSGRENIFLNGSILGMSRVEIKGKFDEIVAFAEVEKFIDTPVKRYSSGMYVRLAFAVAAHLDPEILIVDEVLAVGDQKFQGRCLRKMKEVSKEGRTIVFVSHNMDAIRAFCNVGVYLKDGGVKYSGEIGNVISSYNQFENGNENILHNDKRGGNGGVRLAEINTLSDKGVLALEFKTNDSLIVKMKFIVQPELMIKKGLAIGIGVDSVDGRRLFTCVSSWINSKIETSDSCELIIQCRLKEIPLIAGEYLVSVSISHDGITLDYVENCAKFLITENNNFYAHGRSSEHGYVKVSYEFEEA